MVRLLWFCLGLTLQFKRMTFDDLYWTFCSWGFAIKPEYYQRFKVYFEEMLRRKRVLIISEGNQFQAVIMFFITRNHETLANKPEFSIPYDDENGTEIYIDKMIAKSFNLKLKRIVQDTFESLYPNVQIGFWHREPNNRCVVTYKRRIKHAS